jgi:Tfp pilus assembly protein PilO
VGLAVLGLGKIGVIFIVVSASLAAAGVAYKYWERSVVESAGAKASVEAFEERERFESEQAAIAMQELETLKARMSEIEQGFDSFEQLQQMDWDSELQNAPADFAGRATLATQRVFDARQQLLQKIFTQ